MPRGVAGVAPSALANVENAMVARLKRKSRSPYGNRLSCREFPARPYRELLVRGGGAESGAGAAGADTETAAIGLNEAAGRDYMVGLSRAQGCLGERSLSHRVRGTGGRCVPV